MSEDNLRESFEAIRIQLQNIESRLRVVETWIDNEETIQMERQERLE